MVKSLQKFLTKFSIKAKLWSGFGMLLLIMLVIALTVVRSASITQDGLNNVVEKVQPAVFKAQEVSTSLEKAARSMGFFLLSKQESNKQAFIENMDQLQSSMQTLESLDAIKNDMALQEKFEKIKSDIITFQSYQEKIVIIGTDNLKNIPAVEISTNSLNPMAISLLQQADQIIKAEDEEESSEERREFTKDLYELRYSIIKFIMEIRAYLAFRHTAMLENMDLYKGRVVGLLEKLNAQSDLLTFEQEEGIIELNRLLPEYQKSLDAMIAIHGSNKWRTDSYIIETKLGPLFKKIDVHLNELLTELQQTTIATSNSIVDQNSATSSLVTGLSILGLLIGAVGAWVIAMSICSALKGTVEAMYDIAEGEGDLTRRLDIMGNDEIARLSTAFNLFVDKINKLVSRVAGATEQLASSAEKMSEISADANSGMLSQRSETEQAATAMNQMTATVNEVQSNAQSASEAANYADSTSTQGKEVVNQTITSIHQLASGVESAADVIQTLEKDSEAIGGVLEVIRGIAEQTNLLALNAAIEAARAGEQGRGFAVVADEVRTLASRTQQSTEEIQKMIERLQSGARNAVNVMEDGRKRATESVSQAGKASESLNEIASSVATISAMNTQIAAAANEQATTASEININVVNVNKVSETIKESTEHLALSSQELAILSSELRGIVNQFKI